MEEEFDQLTMDLGDMADDNSDELSESDKSDDFQNPPRKRTRTSDAETLQINENDLIVENDDFDESELETPDIEIFRRAKEQIDNASEKRDDISEWTKGALQSDEVEEIKYDDSFANTAKTEHDFMRAFNLDNAPKLKVDVASVTTTEEIETLQSDIHSNYYEYTDRQQRKEIIGMYKYAKRKIGTKMIISALFALLLFFVENLTLFNSNPTGIFSIAEHPYLHFFVDFGLFLACIACSYEQIYYGTKSVFHRICIPETICMYAIIASVIYSICNLAFIPFGYIPKLYNLPVAFICFLSIVFSFINVVRERYSFGVVSSKDTKFVFNKLTTDESESETDAFSASSKEFIGDLIRIDKAEFVTRYFARSNESARVERVMYPYYFIAILVPFVLSVISFFRNYSFIESMSIWFIGFMFTIPVGILFDYSIPFFIANKKLKDDETTIIGENAIAEFEGADAISVNDTTAFPPYNVMIKEVVVYKGFNIEKILYFCSNGFGLVGGPLAEVFEVATKEVYQRNSRSQFVCSGRSYLCVKIDGNTVIFADRYGITSQGIEIPQNDVVDTNPDISTMYVATNGKLCAKIKIQYVMDEEFETIVKKLNKKGIFVGVRTFDPNINNDLLKKNVQSKKADLRVVRLTKVDDIPQVYEKVDSGVVSKGLSKSLLKAIPFCKNIVKARRISLGIKILASVFGATLLGLYIFGVLPFVTSILMIGFYVMWILVMFIASSIVLLR